MARIDQKIKRSPMLAAVLFCALSSVYLSGIGGFLLASPIRVEPAAPDQISFLAQLSLTDSAAGRLQKPGPSLDSKTQRRQTPLAPLPSGSGAVLLDARNEHPSAFQDERRYSLAAISPPSDRAPPCLTV